MICLKAKARKAKEKEDGFVSAVLYGPEIESISLMVNKKEFEKMFKEVGETLIDIELEGKKYSVLIYDTQVDPMNLEVIHIDFYQPNLKEEVETEVPLELEGEAPALKLGGTLITNMKELTVKALPKDLPSKIKINVGSLLTFEDEIRVKDIILPKGVKITDDEEEIVVQVVESEKVEEELAKPIEELNKEPEKAAEKKKKEEEATEE